jgi:predicted deacetylase
MATIEFGDEVSSNEGGEHALKSKFAIVTIHDACPEFSDRIFEQGNELEKLKIAFNFAIIPKLRREEKNDIRNHPDFVHKIKGYQQPIALHGLYHEKSRHEIEDFYNMKIDRVKHDIKEGMQIFEESDIYSKIFIPPTWAINKYTMDVLGELDFTVAETEEEILVLDKNTRLYTNILNWDTGIDLASQIFLKINKMAYRRKVMQNVQMIRIAMHPRDPLTALQDQIDMIKALKDINYNFLSYCDIGRLFG